MAKPMNVGIKSEITMIHEEYGRMAGKKPSLFTIEDEIDFQSASRLLCTVVYSQRSLSFIAGNFYWESTVDE